MPKFAIVFLLSLAFLCFFANGKSWGVNTKKHRQVIDTGRAVYIDITDLMTFKQFNEVKKFILQKGDRQTFCNKYNDNPHYDFERFHAYLEPAIGQRNICCNPELSDFNTIIIRSDYGYMDIFCCLEQDFIAGVKIDNPPKLKKNRVYLVNFYAKTSKADWELCEKYISSIYEKMKANQK